MCSGDTKEVKGLTVKHIINDRLVNKVDDITYHICLNEACDVVYFNMDADMIFRKQHMKAPIWYKKDANPKYICYCNNVTEEQIINAVLVDGAKNIKDIIRLTGAMENGRCEINNPLGECCSATIKETIKKALDFGAFL